MQKYDFAAGRKARADYALRDRDGSPPAQGRIARVVAEILS